MNARFFACFAVLVVGGCAAPTNAPSNDDESDSDSVASAARDGELRVSGTYEVPVDDRLAHVATNPVHVRVRSTSGGGFTLKYRLPDVIAGEGRSVDLTAKRTGFRRWTLSGPSGSGSCIESAAGEVVCNELLDGVAMSLPEASAAIFERVDNVVERAERVEVAEHFIIDPLGIVRFKRR